MPTQKSYSSSPSSGTTSPSITESRRWKSSSLLIVARPLKQNVISFFARSSPKQLRAAVNTRPHSDQLGFVAADVACNPGTLRANVCQCWVAALRSSSRIPFSLTVGPPARPASASLPHWVHGQVLIMQLPSRVLVKCSRTRRACQPFIAG